MADTPAMTRLKTKAARYAEAQTARDAALAELQDAIRAADDEGGHTRSELIAASGLAKQTVRDALRAKAKPTCADCGQEVTWDSLRALWKHTGPADHPARPAAAAEPAEVVSYP